MTLQELETKVRELGLTFDAHQAMSGSQYITIKGKKFRVSDHFQPSHYQVRNYTDVNSYEEIFNIVNSEDFGIVPDQTYEEDGYRITLRWNDESGGFFYELKKEKI